MVLSRRDLIRAAFAGGAFAWTLAQGPAKLWLPERRVLRETQWLVEIGPFRQRNVPTGDWSAWAPTTHRLLIRKGEPPQVYAKRDFGSSSVVATMWRLEDGKKPEMLGLPGGEPGPFLSTPMDTFGLQDDKTGEWIFRVTCG
jgi:hypothetical protein